MSDRMKYALLFVVAFPVLMLVFTFALWLEERHERMRTEFVTACADAKGKTAFNGRHWECIK